MKSALFALIVRLRIALKPIARRAVRWRSQDMKSVSEQVRTAVDPSAQLSAIHPRRRDEGPSRRLVNIAAAAIPLALEADLPLLRKRAAPDYVHLWPGEHYRLLSALVRLLEPRLVLEIGTYRGHSALAMLPELAPGSRLVTFDIEPWASVSECSLIGEDFADGRLTQIIGDLGDPVEAHRHRELLRESDLIFVDAAKDGVLERRILENFASVGLGTRALVVFDDIRVWNMLAIWHEIDRPKLDLTSLGHWSGTGLIDWSAQPD